MKNRLIEDLFGKRVLVMGLGLHGGGIATTNWLVKHGARVTVTDLRGAKQLATSIQKIRKKQGVHFVLGKHRENDFRTHDMIVQNPAVPNDSPFLKIARIEKTQIVNEATLFFHHCPCPIIGVTGSKGKSTTTALLYHLLHAGKRGVFFGGNLATSAMLDIVDQCTKRSLVVLELSSWQLEGLRAVRKSPGIAVVTNVLDDHLDRYRSRKAYAEAKALIWKWQKPDDTVILNYDNLVTRLWKNRPRSRVLLYSIHHPHNEKGLFVRRKQFIINISGDERVVAHADDIKLRGDHNRQNAAAAILAAYVVGIPTKTIREALRSFRGLPNRLEHVRTVRGVTFINDTTATAPAGSIAALNAIPTPIVLIAGGVDKKLSYKEFAQMIEKRTKALVLLPGTATEKLKKHLSPYHKPQREVRSMEDAVRRAREFACKGDTVLLSPGAASFGLFLHEFDRGKKFLHAVKKLT